MSLNQTDAVYDIFHFGRSVLQDPKELFEILLFKFVAEALFFKNLMLPALSDHFLAETILRLKLNFWIELNEMGFARLDSCKKLWIRRFI